MLKLCQDCIGIVLIVTEALVWVEFRAWGLGIGVQEIVFWDQGFSGVRVQVSGPLARAPILCYTRTIFTSYSKRFPIVVQFP